MTGTKRIALLTKISSSKIPTEDVHPRTAARTDPEVPVIAADHQDPLLRLQTFYVHVTHSDEIARKDAWKTPKK